MNGVAGEAIAVGSGDLDHLGDNQSLKPAASTVTMHTATADSRLGAVAATNAATTAAVITQPVKA